MNSRRAYMNSQMHRVGAELVVNGGFDSDTAWSKESGWTISGGMANANITLGGYKAIYESINYIPNVSYKLVFTILNYVSGLLSFNPISVDTELIQVNANGTYTVNFKLAVGASGQIRFHSRIGAFVGSIDNVSVKRIY